MDENQSARGTPNTVRPKVGAGSHRQQVNAALAAALPLGPNEPAAVFNPGFLSGLDPAALNGHPAVKALAVATCKKILAEQVKTYCTVFGLHAESVAGILRELADGLAPGG